MFGFATASQIASASAASVLFRFTYGLMYAANKPEQRAPPS